MKKLILISILILKAFIGNTQDIQNVRPYLVKDFQGVSITTLKASTQGGNIIVKGGSAISKIEVYVLNNHGIRLSDEETKKRLDRDYDLSIKAESGILQAFAKHKGGIKNWNDGLTISFTLMVPSSITIDISTSGGNIIVSNLKGSSQKLVTSGGNVVINKLQGNILGKTSGGNMEISHSEGQIDLNTSGGNIKGEFCVGNLHLVTSGGNIVLNSLNGEINAITSGGNIDGSSINGNLKANTSGGNIVLNRISSSLDIGTSSGSIEVTVLSLVKFIKAENTGGNILLNLPKQAGMNFNLRAEKIELSDESHFKGLHTKGEWDGTWNGGGIPVSAITNSGTIRIKFI